MKERLIFQCVIEFSNDMKKDEKIGDLGLEDKTEDFV